MPTVRAVLAKVYPFFSLYLLHPCYTACFSGAAKLARRQREEKKCSPRERGRKLEHRAASVARWLFLLTFFFVFYATPTSTERGASAVLKRGGKFRLSTLLRQVCYTDGAYGVLNIFQISASMFLILILNCS